MATTRGQRIGIWVIAIIMAVGTVGSFIVIVLANQNQKIDQETQAKTDAEADAAYKAQAQENADNSEALKGYKPTQFVAGAIAKVKAQVLVMGKGEKIKETDLISASYFGWTADAKIFDSSNKKGADDEPVTFSLQGVITGWTEGLTGQRVGSVIKLSIPPEKAYGAAGSGVIPPNAPLQFIIKIHSIETSAS